MMHRNDEPRDLDVRQRIWLTLAIALGIIAAATFAAFAGVAYFVLTFDPAAD